MDYINRIVDTIDNVCVSVEIGVYWNSDSFNCLNHPNWIFPDAINYLIDIRRDIPIIGVFSVN